MGKKKYDGCLAHWARFKAVYEAYVNALLKCPWRLCGDK